MTISRRSRCWEANWRRGGAEPPRANRVRAVKAFVTGATGFIGGHVARKLRQRGDDVVALVRSPQKAGALRELGCELVEGDLSDAEAIGRGTAGCDAVFHIGAMYKVGVP